VGDLKHSSKYVVYDYVKSNWMGVVARRTDQLCSMEMVTQIAVAGNVGPTVDPELAQHRLEDAARTLHSVNFDRALTIKGQPVVQNSVEVALGLHFQSAQKKEIYPFPKAPTPFNPTDASLMAIGLTKLTSLRLSPLRMAQCLVSYALIVHAYGPLLQLLSGLMSREQLCRILIQRIQSLWSLASRSGLPLSPLNLIQRCWSA
jgi:hypothetical protein